ncbi:MAG: BON domain-containing protein, partial [Rhodopirellula sp. JB055]
MRRKYFGLAMAAIATLGPAQAFGGDREIAQQVMQRLKVSRDAGELKNFNLDMKVNDGVVVFRGT